MLHSVVSRTEPVPRSLSHHVAQGEDHDQGQQQATWLDATYGQHHKFGSPQRKDSEEDT